MTKIFYDHLVLIDEIFVEIETLEMSKAEKQTAKKLVDDLVHQRMLILILDLLPKAAHNELLVRFHRVPFDITLFQFLDEKSNLDIKREIVKLAQELKLEIKQDLKKHTLNKSF